MQLLDVADEALVTAYQVHSAKVAVVEAPWPAHARPKVDAMVTRSRGLTLGILTADCAPVLMADARAGVIGAAHAGWRGAKSGILGEAIAAMIELGARVGGIVAGIGPCIRQDSYEVGPEFHQAFIADEVPTADLFRPSDRDGHFRFDLAGYIVRKLTVIGIESVAVLPFDTFTDADRFFSFRRTTLAGGGDYGRLLSAIALG